MMITPEPAAAMWNYTDYHPDGSTGQAPSDREADHSADQDNESILTDMISPSGHADAQTLACMLQE